MRIRTQIALAFLLLAIVPMAAIVGYSYISSLRAVHQAVEAEAEILTADMEDRMAQVRAEIRHRVERIGAFPARRWVLENETEAEREALYESVVTELGETAPLVDRFEFVPEWAGAAPGQPDGRGPPAPSPPQFTPVVIDMGNLLATVKASIENLGGDTIPETSKKELIEQARRGLEFVQERAEQFNLAGGRRVIEIRVSDEEAKTEREIVRHQAQIERDAILVSGAAALAAAGERGEGKAGYRLLFGESMEVPVYENGSLVGEIRAQVKNEELLRRVLERTRRGRGEIPFAIDGEGLLYATTDEDHDRLISIGLTEPVENPGITGRQVFDDWVVVTSDDETTGLTFGIARPIEESLAEMRATAFRNFGFGSGLIGLALLGVFPLSRRMTHDLNLVTAGAERLASGDLEARVPLRSKSEIGQLARAFNNMAADLEENQKRLLQSERLQVEFDRKTEELEDARRFQLSLLPKDLPEHSAFELAAVMRTATEVGGDYYDFRVAGDGVLTVAIGDATGHGAKAGTMVTVIKSLFSAHPPKGDLVEFHDKAGATIKQMALGRMSMALSLARLTANKLTVSAAGMPPVLVHRAATGKVDEVGFEGMPLGGLDFVYREHTVDVDSGDVVLLMSDGFPELPNGDGDALGYERATERFAATAHESPNEVIRRLFEVAEEWTNGADPADDITFVVIRIR